MSRKLIFSTLGCLAAAGLALLTAAESPTLPVSYQQIDANRDGLVTEAEYVSHAAAVAKAEFKQLDRDGNGTLQPEEAGSKVEGAAKSREPGTLQRVFSGNEGQSESLRKRVSPGPSMRQGGR